MSNLPYQRGQRQPDKLTASPEEESTYKLSVRQSQLLAYIVACQTQGFTPTLQEMAEKLHIRANTVWHHLQALIAKGAIQRPQGKRCRIEVLSKKEGF